MRYHLNLGSIEKQREELLSLIPKPILKNPELFNKQLDDLTIKFMTLEQGKLNDLLSENLNTLDDRKKRCIWAALALRKPPLNDEFFVGISKKLNLSLTDLYKLCIVCERYIELPFFDSNPNIAFHPLHEIFEWFAKFNHVNGLKYFFKYFTPYCDALFKHNFYSAFQAAVENQHLEVMEYFTTQIAPDKLQNMFECEAYSIFSIAARQGYLEILQYFIRNIAPDKKQNMISSNNYRAFQDALKSGKIDALNYIMDQVEPDKLYEMIESSLDEAGKFEVLMCIKARIGLDALKAIITKKPHAPFSSAVVLEQPGSIDFLLELLPDQKINMVVSDNCRAFRYAIKACSLPMVERLSALAPDNIHDMIEANDYQGFREATTLGGPRYYDRFSKAITVSMVGYLPLIERLMVLAPDKVPHMIQAKNYEAFKELSRYRDYEPVTALLKRFLSYASVFAYAEMHDHEYGARHIYPFVQNTLTALREQKAAVEAANAHAVFDIQDPEKATLYFYFLRNLIRRNNPALHDDMLFLLGLPAVKALAHQAVTANEPNELIRLALRIGNADAATLLINIPAVNQLAIANNNYVDEIRGQIDLRALAADNESSMRALSTGEQKRLAQAEEHYKAKIRETGVHKLMTDFKTDLENRYKQHPATITLKAADGSETLCKLPIKWEEFQELNLTSSQQEIALKAYYQNQDHTVLRYLSIPNRWMHPQAEYVTENRQDTTQRWSNFEEYQPLIALLYLAASDKEMPLIDGYTIETRFANFIKELALIARAHNWDDTRVKTDVSGAPCLDDEGNVIKEEYDNLEGDRPSCFSGVKRRLFQSVLGHPLLKIISKETIKGEIIEFVRKHVDSLICDSNRTHIKTALNNYTISLDDTDKATLKILDIPLTKQSDFLNSLKNKYGPQFTDDRGFTRQVEDAFKLKNPYDAHVLNLGYTHWEQFLEQPTSLSWQKPGYRNLQKTKFLNLLKPLETKIEERLIEYPTAKEEADAIIKKLKDSANIFYDTPPTLKTLETFEQSCNKALQLVQDSEIQKHRMALGAVFAAIKNFFVALKDTVLGVPQNRIHFFDSRTDTSKVVERLGCNIEEAKDELSYLYCR